MPLENKSFDTIKQDLEKEHLKHTNGKWYGQEMADASKAVANNIKNTLEKTASNIDCFANPEQKTLYSKKRSDLYAKIDNDTKNLGTRDYMRRHAAIINDLAHKIDNAEDAAINIIQTVQDKKIVKETVDQINKKKNYFIENNDGSLKLTSATNQPTIHEVLGTGLIKSGQIRKIDYTSCKNQQIKSKMEATIGSSTCYLIKGTDKQGNDTFVLQNKESGKMTTLDQRALIREGVKITPPGSYIIEDRKISLNVENYDVLYSDLQKIQPKFAEKLNALENGRDQFFKLTEKKLNERVKYAREHGRELQTEPVSKHTFGDGTMMELHFISGSAKANKVFMRKDEDFGGDTNLYDMMDVNETELLTYLTKRIQTKRSESKKFAKKEIINQQQAEGLDGETMQQVDYGLGLLEKLSDGLIQKEGNNVFYSGDTAIRTFKKTVEDIQHTLSETGKLDINATIQLLTEHYARYIASTKGATADHTTYKPLFQDIIQGNKPKAQSAIRKLANASEVLGDSSAAGFLRDEIINTKVLEGNGNKQNDLKIENSSYDTHLKNIKKKYELTGDEQKDVQIKTNIDVLYSQQNNGLNGILNTLITQNILPAGTTLATDENLGGKVSKGPIRKLCEDLKKFLDDQSEAEKTFEGQTLDEIKTAYTQELSSLQQKNAPSDIDLARMQELELLLLPANTDTLTQLIEIGNETAKEQIKYGAIGGFLGTNLTKRLAEKGGGFIGTNADILNDSYGLRGFRDFSDENVAMTRSGAKMLAEELVFMAITAALIGSGVGAGVGVALASTRLAKRGARGVGVLKKFKDSKRIQNLGKLLNQTKLTRGGKAAFTAVAEVMPGAITRGAIHQSLATTYRGEWDNDFKTQTVELLKKIGMYAILGAVGKMRMSESFTKMVTPAEGSNALKAGLLLVGGRSLPFVAEETGMAVSDWMINATFGIDMTREEIQDNIVMGFAFESLGLFGRYGRGAKNIIMQKDKWIINGKVIDPKVEIETYVAQNPDIKKTVEVKSKQNEGAKNKIENSHNNYKKYSSPEQAKLQSHTKRIEKQDKFELQILQAQDLLKSVDEKLLTPEMKLLRDAGDIVNLSPNDIKRVQRQIGAKADGIWGDKSLNRLSSHLDSQISGVKNHINTPLPLSKEGGDLKSQIEREAKQGNFAGELVTGMDYLSKISDDGLSVVMKKLKNADKTNPVWKDDIIEVQKELGLTGKDVDGVFGPKTLKKMEAYLQDRNANRITKEDLLITKDILREDAIKNGIGDKTAFFAEAKVNGGIITLDGVEYSVKQGKDRIEIATEGVGGGKKPLSDAQKSDLFDRYQNQKVEEYVNNHPDVKNAKIIDEAVAKQQENVSKIDEDQLPAEKLLTEITLEGLTIPPAVVTYFKNNPISESVAKKLTPEDIGIIENYLTHEMHANGAIDKTTQMVLKKREQLVEVYIRDIVAKRADVSSRVEAKQSVEAKAGESVKAVESSGSQNPFDFAKSADDIAAQVFKEIPANATLAKSRVEQFGKWLLKNTVGPTLKFMTDAINWLKKIEFKFPSLKNQITKITKNLESMRINRSVEKINGLQNKTSQEKVNFAEKFNLDKASNQELIALYKMMGGQGDPFDWAVVTLKDGTNTLQTRLKSEITDHVDKMRLEIKKQPQRIEHDFAKFSELRLSNQEVVLSLKEGEQYSVFMGESEYVIKKRDGEISFTKKGDEGDDEIAVILNKGKEYTIGRNHKNITGKIDDPFISDDHMSIKVDENGNVIVRDLKSDNATVLRKGVGKNKNINTVQKSQQSINFNKNTIPGFDSKKLSDVSKAMINVFGLPKHTIDLGNHKLYVTDILLNGGGNKQIIGYTDTGEFRMFYRSGSEAEWRSCPGQRVDGHYSKGENLKDYSYETTTKVETKLNNFFDTLPEMSSKDDVINLSKLFTDKDNLNELEMANAITIENMFPHLGLKHGAVSFYQGRSINDIKSAYASLTLPGQDFNLGSMTLNKEKGYSYKHDYLGDITVDVVQMQWKGKNVDVHFARAKDNHPEKVFVTNIVYSDAKVNSFGVYDKQINAGPITAKPIEYNSQIPLEHNFSGYGKKRFDERDETYKSQYVDIRDLYQEMPLIKAYKKHKYDNSYVV